MAAKYTYETCCVHVPPQDVEALQLMIDNAKEVTLATFRKHCDWRDWAVGLGYSVTRDGGLPLSRDWHIAFRKSTYKGRPCYFAIHSAIEHIFTRQDQ